MQENLIEQGLSLLIYGMGTVFVFLTVLVFATLSMSAVIRRLTPEQESKPAATPASTQQSLPDAAVRSAIEQAIQLFRKQHGR